MNLESDKKYKFIDKDLVNGFVVLTGKEINKKYNPYHLKDNPKYVGRK